ncbi:hypothetical protein A2U01_0036480, partial [Trifolium medium]|nr:hypothetical protein [Trifolium medium]
MYSIDLLGVRGYDPHPRTTLSDKDNKLELELVAKVGRSSRYTYWKLDSLTVRKVYNTFRLIAK